jgi:hypothetical protein
MKCQMTAACGKCGTVYWVVNGCPNCRRRATRSCSSLPRRPDTRLSAQVAGLQARLDDNAAAWLVLRQAIESGQLDQPEFAALKDQVAGLSVVIEEVYRRQGMPLPPALGGPEPVVRHLAALPDGATEATARELLRETAS